MRSARKIKVYNLFYTAAMVLCISEANDAVLYERPLGYLFVIGVLSLIVGVILRVKWPELGFYRTKTTVIFSVGIIIVAFAWVLILVL